MSRIQLALNVSDLDEAVEFYSRIFGTEPHKTRPGYANFAVDNPPLKLVLFEGVGDAGTVNHLGVEVDSTDEVRGRRIRLRMRYCSCPGGGVGRVRNLLRTRRHIIIGVGVLLTGGVAASRPLDRQLT